ncbi:MAG: hypothetical protein ACLSAO_04020 [Anaerovoracaceae bacterium]
MRVTEREIKKLFRIAGNSITKLLLRPFITEINTSGIWTYVKLSCGIAICWGTQELTSAYQVTGVLWSTTVYKEFIYPSGLFIDIPQIFVSANGGMETGTISVGTGTAHKGTKDKSVTYGIFRHSAMSGIKTFSMNALVIGKWKTLEKWEYWIR